MKKAISIILTVILILTILVSCKENEAPEQSKAETTEATAETSELTSNQTIEETSEETSEETTEEISEGPNATPIVYYDEEYFEAYTDDFSGSQDALVINEKQNIKAWLDGNYDKYLSLQYTDHEGNPIITETSVYERYNMELGREFISEHTLPELYIDGVVQNGKRRFYFDSNQMAYICSEIAVGDMYVSLWAYRYYKMPLSELENDLCDILPSIQEYSYQPLHIDGEGFKNFSFEYFDRSKNEAVTQKAMYKLTNGSISVYFIYGDYIINLSSDSPFHLSEAFGKIGIGDIDYNGDNTAYILSKEYSGALYGKSEQIPDISISFETLSDVKKWIDGDSDIMLIDGKTDSGKTKSIYSDAITEKARAYIKQNGLPYLRCKTQKREYQTIYISFSEYSFGFYSDAGASDTKLLAEHHYNIPYDCGNVYEYLLKINEHYGYGYTDSHKYYGEDPKNIPATFTDENGNDLNYDIVYDWGLIPCNVTYEMYCFMQKGYVMHVTVFKDLDDTAEALDLRFLIIDDLCLLK